ncbi:hypothetical protein RHGRI_030559 [Rhododendron griersonianum]|uniref:Bifunctional inhibitor/plant lipid transfer protein/seed storage helical domain-containing protein n=1 Tax=Rhododendron griersonianum TaxID=479676 RepID=A0AAV6IND2_9ERIC|nr:hypothetical protein RHGRI_030559 [Rhododendron griersonianum]
MGCLKISAVLVAVVVLVAATKAAEVQSTASCAQKLVPCADYMNSTNPPASCCNPLRDVVTNESCDYVLILFFFHILLAASAPSPTSSTGSPRATPGNDKNGVGRITWTGMSTILLLCTSMMVY